MIPPQVFEAIRWASEEGAALSDAVVDIDSLAGGGTGLLVYPRRSAIQDAKDAWEAGIVSADYVRSRFGKSPWWKFWR